MKVLIGCESSGVMRRAFSARGHEVWSCDLLPSEDDSPFHYQRDVREVLDFGWDLAIFHPDCTYLTNAAAWALQDPDYERYPGVGYHQKVAPTTLVGASRREAKAKALDFVAELSLAPIERIAMENPQGAMRRSLDWVSQTVQPWWFGDDASKATVFCLKNLPPLVPTNKVEPRLVDGKPRWGNQTDSGQNKLTPGPDRWKERSRTYQGLAQAIASQWT